MANSETAEILASSPDLLPILHATTRVFVPPVTNSFVNVGIPDTAKVSGSAYTTAFSSDIRARTLARQLL